MFPSVGVLSEIVVFSIAFHGGLNQEMKKEPQLGHLGRQMFFLGWVSFIYSLRNIYQGSTMCQDIHSRGGPD